LLRTIKSASNIRGCEPRLSGESRAMAKHGGRTSNGFAVMSRHILESQSVKAVQIRSTERVLCKKTLRTFIEALGDERYHVKVVC
jgi:hypothetical protein